MIFLVELAICVGFLVPIRFAAGLRNGRFLRPDMSGSAIHIPASVWRPAAIAHAQRISTLLKPGFIQDSHPLPPSHVHPNAELHGLDEANPIFNFLAGYYNIKGRQGTRKLARWSPKLHAGGTVLEGATQEDIQRGLVSSRGARLSAVGITYDAQRDFEGKDDHAAVAFVRHRSVLHRVAKSKPILNCFGLHEWAMQYSADGERPPSSRFQETSMPLRVNQQVINAAVERDGTCCTHVDAIRFFAPSAGQFNRFGSSANLSRESQLELEQCGCVHAHMDLLKMAMRLSPYLPAELVGDCLDVALAARRLDMAASPYDTSGFGIAPVPIETKDGRATYQERQEALMIQAAPVREALLAAHDAFLLEAFGAEKVLEAFASKPDP